MDFLNFLIRFDIDEITYVSTRAIPDVRNKEDNLILSMTS